MDCRFSNKIFKDMFAIFFNILICYHERIIVLKYIIFVITIKNRLNELIVLFFFSSERFTE